MSIYSNGLTRTVTVEPSTHNASRSTEFRISGAFKGAVMPNLRIIDMGLIHSGVDTKYNELAGVMAMIKNIHLYDGKQKLSSLPQGAQMYSAFKNCRNSNSENFSFNRYTKQNELGFHKIETSNGQAVSTSPISAQACTDDSATTGKVWLNLMSVFPLLDSLNHLDTLNMFKNLRVVIEYNFDLNDCLVLFGGTATAVSPRLLMDVVQNVGDVMPNPDVVGWREIESDRFFLGQNNAGTQVVNSRINGFQNKSLGHLVMAINYQDKAKNRVGADVAGYGSLGSLAQHGEIIQVVINGREVQPRSGMFGTGNRKLAQLSDTLGSFQAYPMSNVPDLDRSLELLRPNDIKGQLSYFCVDFAGERCNDMQIKYSRVAVTDTAVVRKFNDPMVCRLYCEVSKQMKMENGTYNIIYA